MDKILSAIKQLEALRDDAYRKATQRRGSYASNRAGQYTAYHKAVEIVKSAVGLSRNNATEGDGKYENWPD